MVSEMQLAAAPLAVSAATAPLGPELGQGLFVTWAGMAVVFSVLILLTITMLVLARIFKPGTDEEQG